MKLSDLFDDSGSFHEEDAILKTVADSTAFVAENASIDHVQLMRIFDTSKQRTWLAASDEQVYCLLDDARTGELTLRWSMAKDEFASQPDRTLKVDPNYKRNSGLIDFGPNHKNWLYSKALFHDADPATKISAFLAGDDSD